MSDQKPLRQDDYLALAEENRRLRAEVIELRATIARRSAPLEEASNETLRAMLARIATTLASRSESPPRKDPRDFTIRATLLTMFALAVLGTIFSHLVHR